MKKFLGVFLILTIFIVFLSLLYWSLYSNTFLYTLFVVSIVVYSVFIMIWLSVLIYDKLIFTEE